MKPMEQRHFRGTRGAFHITCHSCDADAHLVGWNRYEDGEEPGYCPYCGSEEIWYADESLR